MELGKPSILSVILTVLVLCIVAFLCYQATKKTDSENYAKGAVHYETHISPVQNVSPLGFSGCSPFVRVDGASGVLVPTSIPKEVKK